MSPPRLSPEQRAALAPSLTGAPEGLSPFVAGPDDLPALLALGDALFGHEALTRADWRRRLTRGHSLVLGLREGDRLVSYTVLELNRRQRRAYVVETGTAPEGRSRGLARWLRDRAHGLLMGLGYRTVATHVRLSNTAAQRLNAALGMPLEARVPGYYDDGEDALYFRAALSQLRSPAPCP